MKSHPLAIDDLSKISTSHIQDFITKHVELVRKDDFDRNAWLENRRENESRRYCTLDRNTEWPWPGAADQVMPVEDTKIEETKAVFLRSYFSGPQWGHFILHRPDAVLKEQQDHDTTYFNWRLQYGMPDFLDQQMIIADATLQDGIGIAKTYWDFRRQTINRVFRRRDFLTRYPMLAGPLAELGAVDALIKSPSDFLMNPRAVSLKNAPAQVLESMRHFIIKDCDFDLDEKEDREALEKIMRGLKADQDLIEYQTVEVIYDGPRTVAVDHDDFIVPSHALFNHRLRSTHRLWFTEETLAQKSEDRSWSKRAVDKVLESGKREHGREGSAVLSLSRLTELQRDRRDGVYTVGGDDMFEIWECHWLMKTSKGVAPVWAIIHPGTATLLKDITYEPYDHGKDPFDFYTFERNDARFYSPRGLPQKIADLSWTITQRHRNKLNLMDMMVPSFTKKAGSFLESGDVNYIPGEFYDVVDHDALRPIPIPDYTGLDEREEQNLLAWVERYVGGTDILSSQQSIHEARTKAEIDAIQSGTQDLLGYRLMLSGRGLNGVMEKIWDLENQYSDGVDYLNVTGVPFRRRSKVEMRRDYTLVAVGRLEGTTPLERQRNAMLRLNMLLEIVTKLGSDQLGKYKLDLGEALRTWLLANDPIESRRIINEIPQEVLEAQQQQAAQAAELGQRLDNNIPVSPREMAEITKEFKKKAPFGARQRVSSA